MKFKSLLLIGALAICGAITTVAQNNTAGPVQGLAPGTGGLPVMDPLGADFTNVNWKVASGTSISANGGATLAYLQADWDAKKFTTFDLGVGVETEMSATGSGFHSGAIVGEAIKNFSNFQIAGKAGGGAVTQGKSGGFGQVGVDLNYNLSRGFTSGTLSTSELFTYVGGGVKVRFYNAGTQEKIGAVWVGVAF